MPPPIQIYCLTPPLYKSKSDALLTNVAKMALLDSRIFILILIDALEQAE